MREEGQGRGILTGELDIRLIHHHQTVARVADALDEAEVGQVAGWVVGRGDNHEVTGARVGEQRLLVQGERAWIAARSADIRLGELGEERVLREAWRADEDGAIPAAESEQEVIEKLVAAVAHADLGARDVVHGGNLVT